MNSITSYDIKDNQFGNQFEAKEIHVTNKTDGYVGSFVMRTQYEQGMALVDEKPEKGPWKPVLRVHTFVPVKDVNEGLDKLVYTALTMALKDGYTRVYLSDQGNHNCLLTLSENRWSCQLHTRRAHV